MAQVIEFPKGFGFWCIFLAFSLAIGMSVYYSTCLLSFSSLILKSSTETCIKKYSLGYWNKAFCNHLISIQIIPLQLFGHTFWHIYQHLNMLILIFLKRVWHFFCMFAAFEIFLESIIIFSSWSSLKGLLYILFFSFLHPPPAISSAPRLEKSSWIEHWQIS